MSDKTGKIIYVYCFARSDSLESLHEKGLDEVNPPVVHTFEEIATVIDRVPMEDFTGPGAEARLKNLEWVAPRAYWHQRVIEEAAAKSTVFPVGFGTLFLTLDSLNRFIQEKRQTISNFLQEMSGREEWAIKAFIQPQKARQRVIAAAMHSEQQPDSPGARYLFKKRVQASVEKEVERRVSVELERILDRVRTFAVDMRQRDLLPGDKVGADEEMVANWAFLISVSNRDSFLDSIFSINRENSEEDLFLRSSGPWPPYSFTPSLDRETNL